jgi:hypothetical protein
MAELSEHITTRARTKCDSDVEHCARTQACNSSTQDTLGSLQMCPAITRHFLCPVIYNNELYETFSFVLTQ